jgi:phenylalanyl-tRNA synthetase beta chain
VERLAGLSLGPLWPEQWGSTSQAVDFFDIKADLEALFGLTGCTAEFAFQAAEHPALQPGQSARILRNGTVVGIAGKLHPAAAKRLDLKKDVLVFELDAALAFAARVPVATSVSKYPTIRRDIAIIVRDDVSAAEIRAAAASAAPDLVQEVRLFDVYRGPGIEAGLKSVALGLILQETSRTLTDADADSAMNAAVQKLQQKYAAVLRD